MQVLYVGLLRRIHAPSTEISYDGVLIPVVSDFMTEIFIF